ncbi:MAG: hypothetical protein KJ798_04850 [Gammaproteobacteria bacterium]|nr:hypothetical protein [Gammaproteobacteria bacterium]
MRLLILEDCPIHYDILIDKINSIFSKEITIQSFDRLDEFRKTVVQNDYDALLVDLNVLDAKSSEVANFLLSQPDWFRNRVILHSSEAWTSMLRLGLGAFFSLPKGAAIPELVEMFKRIGLLV